jgi:hypothetical protein
MIQKTALAIDRPTFYIDLKPAYSITADMQKWLEEEEGAGYSLGGWGIYFYDSKDATMFALKWL